MPSSYPSGTILSAYIVGLGLLPTENQTAVLAALDLDGKAAAAATEFERRTGWQPFLARQQTRFFDPPGRVPGRHSRGGRVLELECGLLSVTTLRVGVTADDAGRELTEGTDYRLGPYNALLEGAPYEYVEFGASGWGAWDAFGLPGRAPRSISIDGLFGFAEEIADDVFAAIRDRGAREALIAGAVPLTGVGEEVTIGSFSTNTSAGVSVWKDSSFLSIADQNFERAVRRYRRITI